LYLYAKKSHDDPWKSNDSIGLKFWKSVKNGDGTLFPYFQRQKKKHCFFLYIYTNTYTKCFKKSFTVVFQMLLCGECYEKVVKKRDITFLEHFISCRAFVCAFWKLPFVPVPPSSSRWVLMSVTCASPSPSPSPVHVAVEIVENSEWPQFACKARPTPFVVCKPVQGNASCKIPFLRMRCRKLPLHPEWPKYVGFHLVIPSLCRFFLQKCRECSNGSQLIRNSSSYLGFLLQ
jgi:hypothetical protein